MFDLEPFWQALLIRALNFFSSHPRAFLDSFVTRWEGQTMMESRGFFQLASIKKQSILRVIILQCFSITVNISASIAM